MTPYEDNTQEFPAGEREPIDPPDDLGPWGSEAVRLGADEEHIPMRPNQPSDSLQPSRRRLATAAALALGTALLGAVVLTALPPAPDDGMKRPRSRPATSRDIASAPGATRPKPSPRPDRAKLTKRERPARAHGTPKSAPTPSPTYLPTPPPQPASQPVTPSPAPAATAAEPTPTSPPPPASGATVAEEFGFER